MQTLIEVLIVIAVLVFTIWILGKILQKSPLHPKLSVHEVLSTLKACPAEEIACWVNRENGWIILQTDTIWIEIPMDERRGSRSRYLMAWRHILHHRDFTDGLVLYYQDEKPISRDMVERDLLEFILSVAYRPRSRYLETFSEN